MFLPSYKKIHVLLDVYLAFIKLDLLAQDAQMDVPIVMVNSFALFVAQED